MADLVTHAAVGVLVKAITRGPHAAAFIAGNLLPDVLSRLPAMLCSGIDQHIVRLPPLLLYGWNPLHMPAGMVLAAWLLSMLFDSSVRRGVFWNLLGGMAVHLGLDLLQSHLGVGYALLFPLSHQTHELGWIGSEDTVLIALPLALFAAVLWRRRRA
ncbi:MAG: hypothetical protein ACI8S6_005845 [Myxococcota bacterium]